MDELNYMKQLVREYFDLMEFDLVSSMQREEITAWANRLSDVRSELQEISSYED